MSRHRSSIPLLTLSIILIAIVGGGGFLLFQDMTAPTITLSPATERVAPALSMTATLEDASSAIKSVSIVARRADKVFPVLEKTFEDSSKKQQVTFTLKDTGLKDVDFTLEITARDASFGGFGRGNSDTKSYNLRMDTTPPRIAVKTGTLNIRRGGTGCVVYSISKEVSQTGVTVGALFFPAFRQTNGDYICFFAFPYYMSPREYTPQAVAVDLAGNAQVMNLSVNRIPKEFKNDTLNISQSFLDEKSAEFRAIVPGDMPEIERFLKVNGLVRKANAATLLQIGKDTSPEILWNGAFMRLPRGAERAGFADHRTYMWQGQKVDEQTHLGFDLASTAHAPIPAANAGRVVFAGYLGIYGNMVVIDHGLGLQSLYSHMSSIAVQKGQTVAKGDILGHTGATGMAGGDHLHFGILIGGLEVNPLEWLDDHWIKDNVTDPIKAAGGIAPQIILSPDAPAKAAKPAASKAPARSGQKKPAKNAGKPARR